MDTPIRSRRPRLDAPAPPGLDDAAAAMRAKIVGVGRMSAASRAVAPTLGADRPRLVVVENVALSTPADPYLSLRGLAGYSGCSVRWLRDRLADPSHPLPHYRPVGKVLVRRSEFDTWLARYRRLGSPDVERVVADVLSRLR